MAWIVSARTASLPPLGSLVELADVHVDLLPLEPADRETLLAQRLGDVPEAIRVHVARHAERGNPLYLEHLAEAVREGCSGEALPATLH